MTCVSPLFLWFLHPARFNLEDDRETARENYTTGSIVGRENFVEISLVH